jgi:hypothetical protein
MSKASPPVRPKSRQPAFFSSLQNKAPKANVPGASRSHNLDYGAFGFVRSRSTRSKLCL